MMAGKLDRMITLQYQTMTTDGAGGFVSKDVVAATVWAEFIKPRVATMQETGSVISEMVREIRIRHRTDIKKGWKVLYGSKTFDVEHAYDPDRESTIIVCREVVR